MQPFFSIIIPTLNEEHFLPKLLSDLTKQKEKNFEVIIVDGASTDKTEHQVKIITDILPIKFIKNERKNVAYQRNQGASIAQGKYLIFLDADARVYSSFTRILYQIIKKQKGILFLPYLYTSEKNQQYKMIFSFVNFMITASQNLGRPFAAGGSIIIEKNFFQLIGGFDENLFVSEDHHLIQKAYAWGVRAKVLRQVKVSFSLRRMKKEGQLRVLYKYILSTMHILLKGDIKKKIYDYEMGGAGYSLQKETNVKKKIKSYFEQVNSFFNKILVND